MGGGGEGGEGTGQAEQSVGQPSSMGERIELEAGRALRLLSV